MRDKTCCPLNQVGTIMCTVCDEHNPVDATMLAVMILSSTAYWLQRDRLFGGGSRLLLRPHRMRAQQGRHGLYST